MFWLKIIGRFLRVLREGATPGQIAAGFLLGFAIGFIPGAPLHVLILVLITLVFSVNLSMAIAGILVALAVGWLFDPLIERLGYWLLVDVHFLKGLWTAMYNSPVIMLTRFNNTVIMGASAAMLALAWPLYWLLSRGVVVYREKYLARVERLRIVQMLKASKFYRWYQRLSGLRLS